MLNCFPEKVWNENRIPRTLHESIVPNNVVAHHRLGSGRCTPNCFHNEYATHDLDGAWRWRNISEDLGAEPHVKLLPT